VTQGGEQTNAGGPRQRVTFYTKKAGLARFGEAMRRELLDDGVRVLTVYPGVTETPMMATSKTGPHSRRRIDRDSGRIDTYNPR
jgi:NAD(P)-dependent dehydrogenase (short-subunit alcohol dehydrogenase family)